MPENIQYTAIGPSLLIIGERGVLRRNKLKSVLVGNNTVETIQEADSLLRHLEEIGAIEQKDGLCWLSKQCEQQYLEIGNELDPDKLQ